MFKPLSRVPSHIVINCMLCVFCQNEISCKCDFRYFARFKPLIKASFAYFACFNDSNNKLKSLHLR